MQEGKRRSDRSNPQVRHNAHRAPGFASAQTTYHQNRFVAFLRALRPLAVKLPRHTQAIDSPQS